MSQILYFTQITHGHTRSQTIQLPQITDLFSAFAQIKVLHKSRKEDLCQKFIIVPAPSIFFQSLFELMLQLKIVLFQGSGGLAPQKPNIFQGGSWGPSLEDFWMSRMWEKPSNTFLPDIFLGLFFIFLFHINQFSFLFFSYSLKFSDNSLVFKPSFFF